MRAPSTSPRPNLLSLVVVLSAATLALAACSSSAPTSDGPNTSKGSSAKLVELSPVTGEPMPSGRPNHPVFIVKIENTEGGQPQLGLNRADLVIEELVEGGLTRLAAFFYSNIPTKVGHVRSMRASDIGIASPVGGQIVASGGAARTYKRVKSAGITVFSEDFGAPGFSSDPAKVRPYNRLVNLRSIENKAKETQIYGPYLSWTPKAAKKATSTPTPSGSATPTPTPTPTPKTVTSANVGFSNSTHTRWAYSGGRWHRVNGHAAQGQDFQPDTLVVMFCKIGNAGYLDPAGNPVPETDLEGTGRAMILAGNKLTEGTWSKSTLRSTISFTGKDGSPVTIKPGHAFLELVPQTGGSVSTG